MARKRPSGNGGAVVLALLVFCVAVLPYVRTVRHGLINLDDYGYVTEYPEVTGGITSSGLVWDVTFLQEGIWMPQTWLTYQADYTLARLFGWSERTLHGWMHGVNFCVHGLNAVLLLAFLFLLFEAAGTPLPRWPCVLAALFWAVHPLRVESVSWIASRKDVLSMGWLLAALCCWVKFRAWELRDENRAGLWYFGAITAFCLGATCKPSVMVFPGLCLVLDWFCLGSFSRPTKREWYYFPVLGAASLAVLAQCAQAGGGATAIFTSIPLWWKGLNALTSYGIYLVHAVWPFDLAVQCTLRHPDLPRLCLVAAPLAIAVAGLTAWGVWRAWQAGDYASRRPVLAAFAWFSGALVPFLGLSGFGYHAFADRFTYIPAAGLSLALAAGLSALGGRVRRPLFAVSGLMLVALAVRTNDQCGYWRDDKALWERTVAVDGERNASAVCGLVSYYFDREHFSVEVRKWVHLALENAPVSTMSGIADVIVRVLMAEGKTQEADEFLSRLREYVAEEGTRIARLQGDESKHPRMQQGVVARMINALYTPGLKGIADAELEWLMTKDDPDKRLILLARGEYLMASGRPEEARKVWSRILTAESVPDKGEYYQYGFVRELIAGRKDCVYAPQGAGGE